MLRRSLPKTRRPPASEEKGTNIQVVLRCRQRSEQEVAANSPVIVEPVQHRRREVLLKTTNKVYSFDRVFGQEATQEEIYNEVAQPILDEVLRGYNCTIFAYGQTGTGKTYTMEGDLEERNGKCKPEAGIIPRAIHKLFETLEAQGAEFSVKVSLIELYNEELRDLLSGNMDDNRTLRIFEDQNGHGVIVQGMEECIIRNASEAIRIMQEGSKNRSIAATKCNEKSSRSHCIFTLTVHIKETIPGGEEVLKVGKLNLVDLAGSENISRSGAEHARAREAGMINQSLLTLGRVINQLVEHSAHVPYRESKLTRLLKDSLGGRTKTCIIATVSVAKMNQEEILSTLDYASRAKNIRNRPEANQRMNPRVLLREYETTIERLKADLQATREQKGVYLSPQTYQSLTDENQSTKDRVTELSLDIDRLKSSLESRTKELEEKTDLLMGKETQLAFVTTRLRSLENSMEQRIAEFQERINDFSTNTESSIEELVDSLERSTEAMHAVAKEKIQAYQDFADKVNQIRDKLREQSDRKRRRAEQEVARFFNSFENDLNEINNQVRHIQKHFAETYQRHIRDEQRHLDAQNDSTRRIRETTVKTVTEERKRLAKQRERINAFMAKDKAAEENATRTLLDGIQKMINKWTDDRRERMKNTMEDVARSLEANGDALSVFQTDFESLISANISQNDERLSQVQQAEERVLNSEDTFKQLNSHIFHMHTQAASYRQHTLDDLTDNKRLIESVSSEIDDARPQRPQSRQMLSPIDQNVCGVKRDREMDDEKVHRIKNARLYH